MDGFRTSLLAEAPPGRRMGPMSHGQFAYDGLYRIVGTRSGVGPLLVALDTSIAIDITEQLDTVDRFDLGQLDPDSWDRDTEALADLIAVWFWRDLRFFVPPSILDDAPPKGIRSDRLAARRSLVEAFATDYWQRGGSETAGWDDSTEELARLPTVSASERELQLKIADGGDGRQGILPPGFDGRLVREAIEEGCHAILSRDDDITKRCASLRRVGLWAGTPSDLLQELLAAGEFSRGPHPQGLIPDLQSLATFYSMHSPGLVS